MGLDLERHRPPVADIHDAGVLPDTSQHAGPHLISGGLTEVAQMHLGGLIRAVLAPHHRVHRQLGVGGAAAEDLADALILVVFESEFTVGLRMIGRGRGVLDRIDECHRDSLFGCKEGSQRGRVGTDISGAHEFPG